MENRDARTLSPEAQHEVRRQAVRLHESGMSYVAIAKALDVSRNSVSVWVRAHEKLGKDALKPKRRGPKPGANMQLTQSEQASIRKKIVDRDPEQFKLPFALWSREAVGMLIKSETGKELDLRQVGRYLKRWGFTPQRPVKRAYQRCDKKVKKWVEEEYPEIERRAKREGAEIHWADETGLKSHDHRGRGYAPRGKTPVRKHNPQYESVNMVNSVTNQGKIRFMCYSGSFNYQVFHKFLKRLIQEANGRKVIVIVDNLRVHHAKVIKRWARRYKDFIELHYIPSYAPDLNPSEYFNCDLKTELAKRPERREKGMWVETVEKTASEIASQPERVASYFESEHIQYAQ